MSIRKGGQIIAGTPRETGGVEIGDIGFAPLGIDESLNLRRYLNGQVISQTQFVSFTNKIKSIVALRPSLATTEANWQAEKSLSKLGQCGRFVIDDDAGTIRLPCAVNIQSLTDLQYLGTIKNESLPNITGKTNATITQRALGWDGSGVFKGYKAAGGNANPASLDNTSSENNGIEFNASWSSSTYQDNAPVQQEAVQYPYYIQVATGVEETLPAIREYQVNNSDYFGQSMYSDVAPDNASWLASNGQYNARSVYPDYYDWLVEQMNAGMSGFVASTAAYTDYDFVVNTADQTFRLPLLNGSEDLPSDRYDSLAYVSDKTYTAPANGWFSCYGTATAASASSFNLLINQTSGERDTKYSVTSNTRLDVSLEVSRGQAVYTLSQNLTIEDFRFIYAHGNGSLYYYVGDTVQDASLINAGAVLGQLSNKADIDASNFNAAGKSLLSGLGMPSNRYIDLTLGASGSKYTAPANGYFMLQMSGATDGVHLSRVDAFGVSYNPRGDGFWSGVLPVRKSDTIVCYYGTGTSMAFRFIYAEGDQ